MKSDETQPIQMPDDTQPIRMPVEETRTDQPSIAAVDRETLLAWLGEPVQQPSTRWHNVVIVLLAVALLLSLAWDQAVWLFNEAATYTVMAVWIVAVYGGQLFGAAWT